mmetsp:Transcript_24526/g.29507  ORF Transcript_24526/g.29507 Transcript_24526/m.29507 type:complete len:185 (+) Transcript_24526:65-619(+)
MTKSIITVLICFLPSIFGLQSILESDGGIWCGDRKLSRQKKPSNPLYAHADRKSTAKDFSLQIDSVRSHRSRRRESQTVLLAAKFKNFEDMLTKYTDTPVLVSFYATWCGPCRLMKKELEVVRELVGDELKIFAVDTERWPHLGARYDIEGLPTAVLFKDGKILHRLEGFEKAETVVQEVKQYL